MSIGFWLYRQAVGATTPRAVGPSGAPPSRRLWIECPGAGQCPAPALGLARAIAARRPDLDIVLRRAEGPPPLLPPLLPPHLPPDAAPDVAPLRPADWQAWGLAAPDPAGAPIVLDPAPGRGARAAAAFLQRWQPGLGLLLGGRMDPGLMAMAQARGVVLVLAGAEAGEAAAGGNEAGGAGAGGAGAGLPALLPAAADGALARAILAAFPGAARGVMRPVRRALVADTAAARALVRLGLPPDATEVTGPLEEPSRHGRVNRAERAALARQFGNRPLWVALDTRLAEADLLARAHLAALRAAHRLLLIVVPATPDSAAVLAQRLAARGLGVARRSLEQDPDDETQVYIADTEGEAALWLDLAPIAWMGGTLDRPPAFGASQPLGGTHPLAVASHGAALLHGPHPPEYGAIYQRLARAGASRVATDASAIAAAIEALLAPSEAAALAAAAWGAASAGAATTRRLLELVEEIMPAGPR